MVALSHILTLDLPDSLKRVESFSLAAVGFFGVFCGPLKLLTCFNLGFSWQLDLVPSRFLHEVVGRFLQLFFFNKNKHNTLYEPSMPPSS